MRDHTGYEPEVFVAFLEGLLTEHNCSYRQASLGARGAPLAQDRRPPQHR